MQVRDVMTQPAMTCPVTMNLAAVCRRMKDSGCGTLPVLDHRGRLAGIVTDRDLALAIGKTDPAQGAVESVMTHRVYSCLAEDDLRQALGEMARHKVRRLPVLDHDGDVIGMISIDDITLWGVSESGVTMQELMAALRSICATETAVVARVTEL